MRLRNIIISEKGKPSPNNSDNCTGTCAGRNTQHIGVGQIISCHRLEYESAKGQSHAAKGGENGAGMRICHKIMEEAVSAGRPVLIKAETSERISDNGTFVEPKRTERIMLAMRKTASMVKRAERLNRLSANFLFMDTSNIRNYINKD